MRKQLDPIEQEYERAIENTGDVDEKYDLWLGLVEYRKYHKTDA